MKRDNMYETPVTSEPHFYSDINADTGYVEVYADHIRRKEDVYKDRCISCMKGKPFQILLTILIATAVSVGLTIVVIAPTRSTPRDINSILNANDRETLECVTTLKETEVNDKSDTFRVAFGGTECPAEWDTYASWCYKAFDTRTTWQQARDHCRSMGTELISIHSSDEMNFVESQYLQRPKKYWIGLNKLQDGGGFGWSDGSHFNFSIWDKGEPNNVNKIENCAQLRMFKRPGVWNDAPCYVSARYICKSKRALQCGIGQWEYFNGSCYSVHVNGSRPLTWEGARRFCKDKGSDLAVIHSTNKYYFILSMVTRLYGDNTSSFWIGLNDLEKKGFFKWVDGVNYTTFSDWLQYSSNRKRECVTMSTLWGHYNGMDCQHTLGYLCEKLVHPSPK